MCTTVEQGWLSHAALDVGEVDIEFTCFHVVLDEVGRHFSFFNLTHSFKQLEHDVLIEKLNSFTGWVSYFQCNLVA